MAALYDRVVTVSSLRDFFRESINTAIDNQNVDVNPHTSHYVVNLLTLFSRSENFYDETDEHCGVRPLALMLADAADADTQEQRSSSLQRIGDVALFTAGFFADSLAYRPVDMDYYVRMGGSAYGSLSDEIKGTTRGMALVDVFREMARKFQALVDVLNEVREGACGSDDVVRVYEIWRKTGSKRAAKILEQNGVVPIGGTSKTH